MASDKNPTNGNGGKWTPSRIDAPFEILQIQELSLADLKVLLYLYSRDLGKKKGKVWPGRKTIAEDTGYSEKGVSRSISNLSALGIIRREGGWRGSTTVYYLKYDEELRAAIKAIPSLAKKARENGRQIRKAGGGKGDKPGTLYSDKGYQTRSQRVTNQFLKGDKPVPKGYQTRSQDTPQTRASTGFAGGECIKELYKEGIKGIVEGGLTTASTNPPNHPQRETEENTPHAQEQEMNLTSLVTTHSPVNDPPSARVNKTETPKGSQPAWAEQEENVSLPSGEHNQSDEEVLGTATPIQPSGHEQASYQPSGAELNGREVAAGRGNGKGKKAITAEAIQVYREAHANRIGTPPTIYEKDRPILARLIEVRSMQAYDGDIDQGNEEVCLNLMHYLKCEGKCENVGFSLEFFSKWYDVINMARIKGEIIDGYDHTWGEIKAMRYNRQHAEFMAKHAAGDGRTFDQDGNPTDSPRSSFRAAGGDGYSHTTVAQELVGGFREKFHRDITQEEREQVMAIADRLGANPARDVIQHALSLTKGKDSEQFINTLCGDLIRMVA
jgi:DNA-binding MarR family transcriptional regulator